MFTKVVAYNKILKDLFLTSSKYLKNLHDALDNNQKLSITNSRFLNTNMLELQK